MIQSKLRLAVVGLLISNLFSFTAFAKIDHAKMESGLKIAMAYVSPEVQEALGESMMTGAAPTANFFVSVLSSHLEVIDGLYPSLFAEIEDKEFSEALNILTDRFYTDDFPTDLKSEVVAKTKEKLSSFVTMKRGESSSTDSNNQGTLADRFLKICGERVKGQLLFTLNDYSLTIHTFLTTLKELEPNYYKQFKNSSDASNSSKSVFIRKVVSLFTGNFDEVTILAMVSRQTQDLINE